MSTDNDGMTMQNIRLRMCHIVAVLVLAANLSTAAVAEKSLSTEDLKAASNVLDRFVKLNSQEKLDTPEGRQLLSGYVLSNIQLTFGPIGRHDKIIAISQDRAAARFPAQDGSWSDLYLYLKKEKTNEWKIHFARRYSVPGIMIESSQLIRMMKNPKREYINQLRNNDLCMKSDRYLSEWLRKRQNELLSIVNSNSSPSRFGQKMEVLGLQGIHKSTDGSTEFIICSMLGKGVKFIYDPDGLHIPQIGDGETLWAESLWDGWHLIREN